MLPAIARRPSIALASRRNHIKTKLLRAARPIPPPSARAATRQVNISHEWHPGLTEKVDKIIDHLAHMIKSRHIDKRQGEAAMMFRSAYDVLDSSTGGALDFDRIRGGGIPGSPPPPRFLIAAERIAEAKKTLYRHHYRILVLVAGEDRKLEDVARLIYDRDTTRGEREQVGFQWREALNQLADLWLLTEKKHTPIRTWRPRDAIPQASTEAARGTILVTPGQVAHATVRGVKMTGG